MKTFDYEQVAAVLAPLKAKLEDCTHGEGNACETLDKQLECHAMICFEVADAFKAWAHSVFSGEVIFDPAAENRWQSELARIHSQATKVWEAGRKAEVPCWELRAQNMLGSALWNLQRLLVNWVTPKPSIGPAARMKNFFRDETAIQEQLSVASI